MSIKESVIAAKKIAAGNLNFPIHVERNNETAEILQSIKMLQSRLATVIGNIQESASGVAESASQLALASNSTHRLMEQQHDETDMVATAMNEMSATVAEVANNTSAAADAAHQASADAQAGKAIVRESVTGIEQLGRGCLRGRRGDRSPGRGIGKYRQDPGCHPRYRWPDQPAGPERRHRGGAGRRARTRLCGGCR